MRQRQRRCSAKRRSWAYTRHSLGAARRCVEGVAPRADDLARPPSGSAGAAADRRCASRRWPYASCRRACARRRVVGVGVALHAVDLGQAAVGPIVLNAYYKWTRSTSATTKYS